MAAIARSGPLTPSQQERWLVLYWREYEGGTRIRTRLWPLEPPARVSTVLRAVARLVARHEILRTTFTIAPDGLPRQVVHDSGTFPLPVTLATDRAPASAPALAAASEPAPAPASEPAPAQAPVPALGGAVSRRRPLWRLELLLDETRVTAVRLLYKHLVTDGGGIHEWHRQFLALCRGHEEQPPLAVFPQPLDRVTPRAPSGASAAHRRDPALGVPQILIPPAGGPPRECTTTLTAHGALPLIDDICRTALVSRPTLILFALAWLLSGHTGQARLLFANILSPRRAVDSSIDCQMAVVPTVIELVETADFTSALRAVQEATLRAYVDDQAPGPATRDLRARALVDRGIGQVAAVHFNYLAAAPPHSPRTRPPPPTPPRPGKAGVPPSVSTTTRRSALLGDLYAPAVAVHLVGEDLVIDIAADARMLPERVTRRFGPLMARLFTVMATDLSAPVTSVRQLRRHAFGTPAAPSGTPAQLDGLGNWQDLRTLGSILATTPGVRASSLALDSGETVARVALAPGTSVFDVHEHVLTRLAELRQAAAPQRYVPLVNGQTSPHTTGWPADGWRPARDRPVLPPLTPEEHALCQALARTHPRVDHVGNAPGEPGGTADMTVDMALTYTEAGGELLRAPAVVHQLRQHGLTGLRQAHFASPHTLRAIARALVPVRPTHPRENCWDTPPSSSPSESWSPSCAP